MQYLLAQGEQSDKEAQRTIQTSAEAETEANIIIMMQEKANLVSAKAQRDKITRRQMIVDTLQATAKRSQGGVRTILANAETQGAARDIRPLWIINSVSAKATWPTILALAAPG